MSSMFMKKIMQSKLGSNSNGSSVSSPNKRVSPEKGSTASQGSTASETGTVKANQDKATEATQAADSEDSDQEDATSQQDQQTDAEDKSEAEHTGSDNDNAEDATPAAGQMAHTEVETQSEDDESPAESKSDNKVPTPQHEMADASPASTPIKRNASRMLSPKVPSNTMVTPIKRNATEALIESSGARVKSEKKSKPTASKSTKKNKEHVVATKPELSTSLRDLMKTGITDAIVRSIKNPKEIPELKEAKFSNKIATEVRMQWMAWMMSLMSTALEHTWTHGDLDDNAIKQALEKHQCYLVEKTKSD